MEVYRLAKERHGSTVAQMMSGEGARQNGGRWNFPMTPLVYAGSTRSLSALEIVVNAASDKPLEAYWLAAIHIPDLLIQRVTSSELPEGWDVFDIETPASSEWGTLWAEEGQTAAVQVPSSIVPEEYNILINPLHPDFPQIQVLDLQPYPLDQRVNAKTELKNP